MDCILMKPCSLGHVRESSVAVVSIKNVVTVIRNKEIIEAVVIVVADGHRRRPSRPQHSSHCGHVRKCSVAVVLVEPIRGTWRVAFQPRSVQDKEIDPPVIV